MEYDIAIIGAGWAGFNAAQKAKQSGLKACLIEKADIGGTCLNSGCIPTKALIHSVKAYTLARKSAPLGVEIQNPAINFFKIQERKNNLIRQLRQGMQSMLKGTDYLTGQACFASERLIRVDSRQIEAKFFLIATGSNPAELPFLPFNGQDTVSSTQILNLSRPPESLLVIGGGVIGCEFAAFFSALGVPVSIVEKMPQLLPGLDAEIARRLENIFKKKGIKVYTGSDARSIDRKKYALTLVCVGRKPECSGLGLDGMGLRLGKDRILTDEYLRTDIGNIYAAGDCRGGIMLAHFAGYQGCLAVENMFNPQNPKKINPVYVPNCIFTDPEIASVGLSEEQARQSHTDIKIYKFDFLGSGMARIMDEAEGMIKIISDDKTGRVLGGAIIGPKATELIAVLTLAASAGVGISGIKETIFAHPTLSESIHQALG